MNLSLEYKFKNNKIKFKNNYLNITVKNCNDNQIKIIDKRNYYHCENPICNDNCPVNTEKAVCLKSNITNINRKEYNKCQCTPGWNGKNCEEKDYIKLKYFLFYIIFIYINFNNKNIINNIILLYLINFINFIYIYYNY